LQQFQINQPKQFTRLDNTTDLSLGLESAASILGGLFDLMKPSPVYDETEAEFLRQDAKRRKKKKDNQYRHRI
jgi:hypothetical protein